MTNERIVIIGAGLTGLCCARRFAKYGLKSVVLDVGADRRAHFVLNRRVRYSRKLSQFLRDEGVAHSSYMIRPGVMVHPGAGGVVKCPAGLKACASRDQIQSMRDQLVRKMGLLAAGDRVTSPWSMGAFRSRLAVDWESFVSSAESSASILECTVNSLSVGEVRTSVGTFRTSRIIVTLPLWKIAEIVAWPMPSASAISQNAVGVHPRDGDWFSGYDIVLTPHTPDFCIYQLSWADGMAVAHFSGPWNAAVHDAVLGDLNYVFSDGWAPAFRQIGAYGAMCRLSAPLTSWPKEIVRIGKYAEWSASSCLASSIAKVDELAKAWA